MFNLIVLSTGLNVNSKSSYNVEPSWFNFFHISLETALTLTLPSVSTTLVQTFLYIPACKLDTNTLTS